MTRITPPRPVQTYIVHLPEGKSVAIRHWRPRDAQLCRRCEECTVEQSGDRVSCAKIIPTDELATLLFSS
jgi:hypothetical protein